MVDCFGYVVQEDLLQRLKEYKEKYNTPFARIGKYCGTSGEYISMFYNGKRERIGNNTAIRLDKYLIERGYV